MRLSKRERAQVVELLRCAADGAYPGAFTDACIELAHDGGRISDGVYNNAVGAFNASPFIDADTDTERYRHRLLEAALRVEEGNWP